MNIVGSNLPSKPMFFELAIDIPPPILTLAINPRDFNKTFTKKVTESRIRPRMRNIGSYMHNFDYDELDVMTCSGSSAMFYGPRGLTTSGRTINTLAFKNLKSLVEIYRNNGRNYNTHVRRGAPMVTGGSGLIKSVGRVIIAYDNIIYKGSFDSFSLSENDQKPFNIEFNYQFVISDTIDVRNP